MAEPQIDGVPLREYVEALFEQEGRRTEREADEREKAASALREEQHRTVELAEREREKAAAALRAELTRQIEQGDQSLRDHVRTQIDQIKLLATSLDDQSRLRIEAVADSVVRVEKVAEQHVEQLRREREMVTTAQQDAIAKAEIATEKRFESVNEFRQQSMDRERTMQEQTARLTNEFVRREVVEAQMSELRKEVSQLSRIVTKMTGADEGTVAAKRGLTSTAMMWIAGLGLLVAVLSIAVVVILANHQGP